MFKKSFGKFLDKINSSHKEKYWLRHLSGIIAQALWLISDDPKELVFSCILLDQSNRSTSSELQCEILVETRYKVAEDVERQTKSYEEQIMLIYVENEIKRRLFNCKKDITKDVKEIINKIQEIQHENRQSFDRRIRKYNLDYLDDAKKFALDNYDLIMYLCQNFEHFECIKKNDIVNGIPKYKKISK